MCVPRASPCTPESCSSRWRQPFLQQRAFVVFSESNEAWWAECYGVPGASEGGGRRASVSAATTKVPPTEVLALLSDFLTMGETSPAEPPSPPLPFPHPLAPAPWGEWHPGGVLIVLFRLPLRSRGAFPLCVSWAVPRRLGASNRARRARSRGAQCRPKELDKEAETAPQV